MLILESTQKPTKLPTVRRYLLALTLVMVVFLFAPEVEAQNIDHTTAETIKLLLEANILQLGLIAMIIYPVGSILSSALGFWRKRNEDRAEAALRQREQEADDKLINRVLDLNEKLNTSFDRLNENLAAQVLAFKELASAYQETRALHRSNRGDILETKEAVTAFNREYVNWSKLHNDSLVAIDESLEGLRKDLQGLSASIRQLKTCDQKDIERAVNPILAKVNEMLRRWPPTPPPPTEPDDAAPPAPPHLVDSDGAKTQATVDFTPTKLPKTGTEG